MATKIDLITKLLSIGSKYSNGEYGFEISESLTGEFQFHFIQVIAKLCFDPANLTKMLNDKFI